MDTPKTLEEIRERMLAYAEKIPLPEKFVQVQIPNQWFEITDTESGRTVRVGLDHLRPVREALAGLFGPPPTA